MTDACFLKDNLEVADDFRLEGPEGRHAAVVKRIQVGETVLVTDGRGSAIQAVTISVGKDYLDLKATERLTAPTSPWRLVVVQALAKGDRAELAVEMLTELGVDEIVAWQSERSISRWRDQDKIDKGLAKWQVAAREAMKQSRRFHCPAVTWAADTKTVVNRLEATALAMVMHETASDSMSAVSLPEQGEIVIVIGPEGGLTPEELAAFENAGAILVSLGDGILRTSTAGVVALAQLKVLLPDIRTTGTGSPSDDG